MVKSALIAVGWDAKESDGHQEKLLRSTVIGLLDVFCWKDPTVVAEARQRLDRNHTLHHMSQFQLLLRYPVLNRFDAHWVDPAALSSGKLLMIYICNFHMS